MAGMMTEAVHTRVIAAVAEGHEQRFVSRMSTMRITACMVRYMTMGHTMPMSITPMSVITVHKKILRC
ncbi:MAG: hypothetical protein EKK48_17080 [Candidatus Melainabacteria bacterium]|nr:MAG: hypothetical protein EKK48_17080 [Candidatus Melainabacteria bacterium]